MITMTDCGGGDDPATPGPLLADLCAGGLQWSRVHLREDRWSMKTAETSSLGFQVDKILLNVTNTWVLSSQLSIFSWQIIWISGITDSTHFMVKVNRTRQELKQKPLSGPVYCLLITVRWPRRVEASFSAL